MTKSTSDFILHLQTLGIHLRLEGEDLRLSAPREALTDAIRSEIRQRKQEILQLLSSIGTAPLIEKPPIAKADRNRPLPLSFAQQRLYFMQQFAPDDPSYNLASAFRFRGHLELAALEQALWLLEERHEILRTVFEEYEDEPVQRVLAPSQNPIAQVELTSKLLEERETEARLFAEARFQETFDLAKSPLYRVWLLCLEEGHWILLMSMHHIISDAWSMNLMMRELVAGYWQILAGTRPSTSKEFMQYGDFASWQRTCLSGRVFEAQSTYWRNQLAQAPAVLSLPTDYPRPEVPSYDGKTFYFTIPAGLVSAFRTLAQTQQATMSMAVQALFALLMARYSGQRDICVGHTIANRNHPDLESMLGFFVNTLVLRTSLEGEPDFGTLLARVRQTSLAAYEHEDVPFERVVELIAPPRSNRFTPLFQVMCDFQNARVEYPVMADLTLEPVEWGTGAAKFDLTFDFEENDGALNGVIEYRSALFRPETIALMAQTFVALMERVTSSPDTNVWALALPVPPDAATRVLPDRWHEQPVTALAPGEVLEDVPFVAPRNEQEQAVADMFREVLNLQEVGVHHSFFDLGGHSLLAARLLSRIRRRFDHEISLPRFFENPTIAMITTCLEVMDWSRQGVPVTAEGTEEEEMGFL